MILNLIAKSTCLLFIALFMANCSTTQTAQSFNEEEAVLSIIENYKNALKNKSLIEMEKTVREDLLVIEGVHVNQGWADYRDHHIGPEMKEWNDFATVSTKNLKTMFSGDLAVVSMESLYKIKMNKETVDLKAAETFVLKKDTSWRISSIHFSGKSIKVKK